MNILIGKIGQKIFFDRSSKGCDRSNTNGNVGTYLLFRLMIENGKENTFYVASENDLSLVKNSFENVVDASLMNSDDLNKIGIDATFILTGMMQFEKSDRFIDIINNVGKKFILLSDDPRCLDSVALDERIVRKPEIIISQFEGSYSFKGEEIAVHYIPIERASCYKCEMYDEEKSIDIVVVSNTSGEEYNRVKIISQIIKGLNGINVYGRLSEEERTLLGKVNCKGEIKYTEMQKVLRRSRSTLVVPIKKGWVTSKYVEALMNGVLPIFHEDYNTRLLGKEVRGLVVISNGSELEAVMNHVVKKEERAQKIISNMREKLIAPYIDGKILYESLMKYAKGEVQR